MIRSIAFVTALVVLLAGCASLRPAPVEEIARLPVVRVGATPGAAEYVVFYPAGHPFPATLEVGGSLLAAPQKVSTAITFTRDLYLYKYWASHDGKHWRNSHELLGVAFSGGFDVAGGHANVQLDAR